MNRKRQQTRKGAPIKGHPLREGVGAVIDDQLCPGRGRQGQAQQVPRRTQGRIGIEYTTAGGLGRGGQAQALSLVMDLQREGGRPARDDDRIGARRGHEEELAACEIKVRREQHALLESLKYRAAGTAPAALVMAQPGTGER